MRARRRPSLVRGSSAILLVASLLLGVGPGGLFPVSTHLPSAPSPARPSARSQAAALDPAQALSNRGSSPKLIIPCTNCELGTIPTQLWPWPATFDPYNQLIYVPDNDVWSVAVLNGTTQTDAFLIPTPVTPVTPTFDPDNGDLYVSEGNNPGTVTIIDGATNIDLANLTVGAYPVTPALDPITDMLYVSNEGISDNVSVISGATNQVVNTFDVSGAPYPGIWDPANQDVYIPTDADLVVVYNASTDKFVGNISVGGLPQTPVFDNATNEMFVANYQTSNVSVISTTSNTLVATIPVGKQPIQGLYDAVNGYVLVPEDGTGEVAVINPVTHLVARSLATGNGPQTPTYDPANSFVYIPESGDNDVTVVSQSLAILGDINVWDSPETACFDPVNDDLYVPNGMAGTGFGDNVSVISGGDGAPLSANATVDTSIGASWLHVNFTGTALGGSGFYSNWLWNFGNGQSSNAQDPSYVYKTPGNYSVTVAVSDSAAARATSRTLNITVLKPFDVAASSNLTNGTAPLSVAFKATPLGAVGAGATYEWYFGDGTTSTQQDPVHVFTSPGTYHVYVNGTNTTGANATSGVLTITVWGPLSVSIEATPSTGDAPLKVDFTADPTGGSGRDLFAWSFGNSNTSTLQNPSNVYGVAGSYPVSLTVTDDEQQVASSSTTIVVAVGAPIVVSSASPTFGDAPLVVDFSLTAHRGTPPFNYTWRFGDGGVSYLPEPSHVYLTAGSYTAWVWVNDSAGASTPEAAPAVVVSAATHLGAAAIAYPTYGPAPLSVGLTGAAAGGGPPYAWMWRFGDGSSSTAQDPTHTYTTGGNYTIWLWVNDSFGTTATASIPRIEVNSSLYLTDSASALGGQEPFTVNFGSVPHGGEGPYTVVWQFGDGTSANGQNASHSYGSQGTFLVWPQVTDARGRTAQGPYLNVTITPGSPSWISKFGGPIGLAAIGIVIVLAVLLVLIGQRRLRKGLADYRSERAKIEDTKRKREIDLSDLAYLDAQEKSVAKADEEAREGPTPESAGERTEASVETTSPPKSNP